VGGPGVFWVPRVGSAVGSDEGVVEHRLAIDLAGDHDDLVSDARIARHDAARSATLHPPGVESRSESPAVYGPVAGRVSMNDDCDLTVVNVCWSNG
jgi:hypothetical protein